MQHSKGIVDKAYLSVIPPTEALEQLQTCHCNSSQAQAVIAAASQTLTLIHGPPGTGKVTLNFATSTQIAPTMFTPKAADVDDSFLKSADVHDSFLKSAVPHLFELCFQDHC